MGLELPPAVGNKRSQTGRFEANPAYMQWTFAHSTRDFLVHLASSTETPIALLGCPSIHESLPCKRSAYLFDIDERFSGNDNAIICDIARFDFSSYKSFFKFVLFDPPWYAGNFRLWSRVAYYIAEEGATIIFPLFQSLLRPRARVERLGILHAWRHAMKDVVQIESVISYTMPKFEENQLLQFGIDLGDWRVADLILAQNKRKCMESIFDKRRFEKVVDTGEWATYHDGNKTVAIREKDGTRGADTELQPLGIRGLLPSPSLRASARKQANVLISDGRAAYCPNPKLLIDRLRSGDHSDLRRFDAVTLS